jgi:hypothetical protein
MVAAILVLLLGGATPGAALTPSLQSPCEANPAVTTNLDSGPGSLREALAKACVAGTITFATSVVSPITLLSELPIEQSLTIQGPGARALTISGNHAVRVFGIGKLTPGIVVTLSGLTIANGQAPISQVGEGGGIYFASHQLTIANCTLSGNYATGGIEGFGGGIFNAGDTLNIINSWLFGNSASSSSVGIPGGGSDGGAIFNAGSGTVNVTSSTLSGNSVDGVGGFGAGGAIYNNNIGTVNVTNSTLFGNTATGNLAFGGAINNGPGTVRVTNSTLAGNTADGEANGTYAFGGGIYGNGGPVLLKNTIVAGNTVRGGMLTRGSDVYNCCGTHGIVSDGYNLIGKGDPTVDLTDRVNHDQVGSIDSPLDPKLDPSGLQDNGGPTLTVAILDGSPAIDQGSAANDPTGIPITTDQRGFARPIDDPNTPNATGGNGSDIGAFEFSASRCTVIVTNSGDSGPGSLREAIANACVGGTITFANTVVSPITLLSELSIEQSVTIQGPGASALTVSGNHAVRVFGIGRVTAGIIVTLSGLTIANGQVSSPSAYGGGIYFASGTLTIANCTLSGNSVSGGAVAGAGGIFNAGDTLNVINSWLDHNSASSSGVGFGNGSLGGAIYNSSNGTVNVTASTLSANSVKASVLAWGGAIYNNIIGTVNVTNSTLSGNAATGDLAFGGGINTDGPGTVTITNSTLSGNTVEGAANGTYAFGGGIYSTRGQVLLKNTIVAGNTAEGGTLNRGSDVYNCCYTHGIVSQGYNLIGKGDPTVDLTDRVNHDQVGSIASPLDPRLGGLQDNGGPTPTIALLAGSPAIDQGTAANDPATGVPITTDQRGVVRAIDDPNPSKPDIGAFEFVSDSQPTISAVDITLQQGSLSINSQIGTVSNPSQGATTLTVTAAPASGSGVTVSNITITAGGQVFADVVASCTATNSTFVLTVTASNALSASTALTVTVSADTPPMLGNYPAAVGPINPGTTTFIPFIPPSAAPSDNGTFSLSWSAPGFGGALSVSAITGVVTVSNAGPPGSYTVTVKATDNCGLTSARSFTLLVNHPPTISGQNVSLQEGALANARLRIATVNDVDDPNSALLVRVNLSSSATVNRVTLSQITVGPLGVVRANLVAACGAADAGFTLTVRDSGGLSASAPLHVAVSRNTPPTLGRYSPARVHLGASTTVFPDARPADNGVITSLTAASNPSFGGSLSVDPQAGAVIVSNARPLGDYQVTVTATDNCGATSVRSFILKVRLF